VPGAGAGAGDGKKGEDTPRFMLCSRRCLVCPYFTSHKCVEVHGDMKALVIDVGEFWCVLLLSTYLSKVELAMLGEYFMKIVKRDFSMA